MSFPDIRMRRNRKNQSIRNLVQENHVSVNDLILPIFITDKRSAKEEIKSMPDIFRLGLKELKDKVKEVEKLGVNAIAIFPKIDEKLKDKNGSYALSQKNYLLKYINEIKSISQKVQVIVDVALDPYTSHGHDGVLNKKGDVDNDATCEILAQQAMILANAGADIVAPSDMMDGRVGIIRRSLDENDSKDISILAYTAKYASNLYAPFRDAVGSTKNLGKADKKTYQMNPANIREAVLEAELDIKEGADFLMVKPGMFYLDVIKELKNKFNRPIFAYQVSGEYAMLKKYCEEDVNLFKNILYESMLCFKRAGSDAVLTYAACEMARILKDNGQ